jgi:hypothetical protein
MKILNKIALSLTALVSFSTVICGFSIANAPSIEPSSLSFHAGIGLLTILLSFATLFLFAKQKK